MYSQCNPLCNLHTSSHQSAADIGFATAIAIPPYALSISSRKSVNWNGISYIKFQVVTVSLRCA